MKLEEISMLRRIYLARECVQHSQYVAFPPRECHGNRGGDQMAG